MITEIVASQLKANVILDDTNSSAHKAFREAGGLLLSTAKAQYVYYGTSEEKPELAFVAIGWNSMDDPKEFASLP